MAITPQLTVQEATVAQAQAGTDDTTVMTPYLTAQAIAALAPGVANVPWTSYTPTLSAGTGSLTTASATGRYCTLGKTCFFQMSITITTNGSAAGFLAASLPFTPQAFEYEAIGRNASTATPLMTYIPASTPDVILVTQSNVYPGGNGYVLNVSGTYETV